MWSTLALGSSIVHVSRWRRKARANGIHTPKHNPPLPPFFAPALGDPQYSPEALPLLAVDIAEFMLWKIERAPVYNRSLSQISAIAG